MNRFAAAIVTGMLLGSPAVSSALVSLDEGALIVDGVQLFREHGSDSSYRYVPQYPRLSTRSDGSWELLCLKYVGDAGSSKGGLFHALVEFSLPPERVAALQEALRSEIPKARIAGPVELLEADADGEETAGAFRVISSTLSPDTGKFTQSLISSGHAPLLPGSKAAIAALLEPQGATLLWNSFQGPTSDVSIAIAAYFLASVRGYNARVEAEMDVIHQRLSEAQQKQRGFERSDIHRAVDSLVRSGDIRVAVLDASQATGVDAQDMKQILEVVTDRLAAVMFDVEPSWSAQPGKSQAAGTGTGASEAGTLPGIFQGGGGLPYAFTNSYVLKARKDIRRSSFTLTLDKNAVIQVPLNTAGNLGGLYAAHGSDPRYFRVVDLDDPAFELREVHFQLDGQYVDAFRQALNFVTVNFRKAYEKRPAFTRTVTFDHADVEAGRTVRSVAFPRLGAKDPDWTEYEYQIRWSLRDGPTLGVPPATGEDPEPWLRSRDVGVSLAPPFRRELVEIELEREAFASAGLTTAVVEFAGVLGGERRVIARRTLRSSDAESVIQLSLYRDRGQPIAYRVSWFGPRRQERGDLQLLPEANFLFLVAPARRPDAAEPQ